MRTIHAKPVATIMFGILFASLSPAAKAQREDSELRLGAAALQARESAQYSVRRK